MTHKLCADADVFSESAGGAHQHEVYSHIFEALVSELGKNGFGLGKGSAGPCLTRIYKTRERPQAPYIFVYSYFAIRSK